MFSYEKFIRILKENISNSVILYRGDSSEIEKFDSNKFDNKAIYGLGLYLTDNKNIAYSYTLKGGNIGVDAELYIELDNEEDAKEYYIISKLLNEVNSTNYDEKELYDLYITLSSYEKWNKGAFERYKSGDKYFFLDKDKVKNTDENTLYNYYSDWIERETKNIERRIKEYNDAIKKFKVFYDKANSYFDKISVDISFVKGNDVWTVVSKSKNTGKVSEFSIKSDSISKCYNASYIISKEVESVLKKFVNRYNKQNNVIKHIGTNDIIKNHFTYKYIKSNATHNNNYPFTLSNFFYENRNFRYKDTIVEKETWQFFIIEMQKLGYKGIVYDGGEHLRTGISHNAYVIWNMNDVQRIK